LKIYTKTGDEGDTSLFGGKRVHKDDLRLEAYGTIDELNSAIGSCRAFNAHTEIDSLLAEIQNDLFILGADLATPQSSSTKEIRRIGLVDITRLEQHIDSLESRLSPLSTFILPGGAKSAVLLHVARTICRRAERRIVSLARHESIGTAPIMYTNRLSDLLFVLARIVNMLSGNQETPWKV